MCANIQKYVCVFNKIDIYDRRGGTPYITYVVRPSV